MTRKMYRETIAAVEGWRAVLCEFDHEARRTEVREVPVVCWSQVGGDALSPGEIMTGWVVHPDHLDGVIPAEELNDEGYSLIGFLGPREAIQEDPAFMGRIESFHLSRSRRGQRRAS